VILDSFMVISRYPIKMDSWYFRPGLHHAFRPTPSEIPKFEANPNLVLDILIAMGVAGMHPEIQLFNPSLAKPDAPPEPDIELRYKSDEEGINAADKSEGSDHGDEGSKKRLADQQIVDTMSSGVSAIKLAFPGPTPPEDPQSSDEGLGPRKKTKTDETKRNTERKRKNPSLVPWPLIAKEFPRVWKSMKGVEYPHNFKERGPIIGNVAISPRGAKWILGVGEAESVFVWRLRDTALEKAKS